MQEIIRYNSINQIFPFPPISNVLLLSHPIKRSGIVKEFTAKDFYDMMAGTILREVLFGHHLLKYLILVLINIWQHCIKQQDGGSNGSQMQIKY